MARQHGPINFTGQLGGISFYKTEDGYLARMKTAHSRSRVMCGPRFVRVRENSSELGRASSGGKVLRTALRGIQRILPDKRMYSRMAGVMLAVVRLDKVHGRGLRTVTDGDARVLEGFEFNKRAFFADVVRTDYQVVADRVAGTATARVPILRGAIVMPAGAMHARLVAGVAAVDFRQETYDAGHRYSHYIDLRDESEHVVELVQGLPLKGGPVVVVLGIAFFQQVNGEMCRLADKTRNAMVIAGVVSANGPVKRDEAGEAYSPVWFTTTLNAGVFPLGRVLADGCCLARGPDVTFRAPADANYFNRGD